jgi:hypothetical protein
MSAVAGRPVALPPASSAHGASSQAGGKPARPRATTDGAPAGAISKPLRSQRRVSARNLEAIRQSLTDRDWQLLRSVHTHRFLSTGQLQRLHFADHASEVTGARIARRVLQRLRELRVLGVLERRIGGIRAGSSGMVYFVDTVGDRLLRADTGARPRRRAHEPTATFMAHTLAVAETHLRLVEMALGGRIELLRADLEPAAWRRYTGPGLAAVTLKPDLYAETGQPGGEFVDAWFVEVDLGHESIPTLLTKCREYEAYRRSGTEQQASGAFPLVVWSMGARTEALAQRRRTALATAIGRERTLTAALFHLTAPEHLTALIERGGGG